MLFRRTERRTLMHKDVAVLTGEYDPRIHGFRNVSKVYDPAHLPVGVRMKNASADLDALNRWLVWRGIPNYRVDLERLLKRLQIRDEKDLLEEDYALSVSDHYWVCPAEQRFSYAGLNYFEHTFDCEGFAQAMFRPAPCEPAESALHTPGNTLCGYHRKAWMRIGDQLCLYKGSTGFYQQECINEWLASMLAERLGLYCVPYDVTIYEGQLVSVCPNFLNLDLDLVTASDAIASMGGHSGGTAESFRAAMEAHGITDAQDCLEEMYLLDYLMMNTDRHGQNAGILVDANTNQWIGMAPIFDTGTGLGCFTGSSGLGSLDRHKGYRLFSKKHLSFETLPERIENWGRYDFTAVDDMPELFRKTLAGFRSTTGISDERIEALGALLESRIERIKAHAGA